MGLSSGVNTELSTVAELEVLVRPDEISQQRRESLQIVHNRRIAFSREQKLSCLNNGRHLMAIFLGSCTRTCSRTERSGAK
jgi:hypothetical protein